MSTIPFDNSFARLPEAFFARVSPAVVPQPSLIAVNESLAAELGLDAAWLRSADGLAMLSGNGLPAAADPIALVYAGHQFGGWSPQLGDGRATLIGEVVGLDGIRRDLQLKGSGQTPFSRRGDGKAPLGPVLREYIVSEAMFALGIPTTRALAAVATGEIVHRETHQPGAILTRVAQSHVRIGTFEYFRSRQETGRVAELANYVIDRHYRDARRAKNPYLALLENVVQRQAGLIARWMQVGFIHGVMNTDNMQIAGETIDFGPCAFMESFHPQTVLSSIDQHGRYAWCNQPSIAQWNLTRFAETLLPLLADDEDEAIEQAKSALELFAPRFNALHISGFLAKMGIELSESDLSEASRSFVDETFKTMTDQKVDFTLFFRQLTRIASGEGSDDFLALFDHESAGEDWLLRWHTAKGDEKELPGERLRRMRAVNPIFIPRNHRVEEAIQAGLAGNYAPFERLNSVLARPFDEQPEHSEFEKAAAPEERVERTFCGT